jgi:hypothetical protein
MEADRVRIQIAKLVLPNVLGWRNWPHLTEVQNREREGDLIRSARQLLEEEMAAGRVTVKTTRRKVIYYWRGRA